MLTGSDPSQIQTAGGRWRWRAGCLASKRNGTDDRPQVETHLGDEQLTTALHDLAESGLTLIQAACMFT
jgi:hypothetical protein